MADEIKALKSGSDLDETVFAGDVYSMGKILEQLYQSTKSASLKSLISKMKADDPKDRPSAKEALASYLSII